MEKNFKKLFLFNTLAFLLIAVVVISFFDTFFSLADKTGAFSDFSEVCNFALSKNPYIEYKTSYAPLVMLIIYPFAKMIGHGAFAMDNARYLTSFILFNFTFFLLVALLTMQLIKNKKISLYVYFASICSAPFVFCVIRGNTVIVSLSFILAFLATYNSKNCLLKEVSLIMLSVAGVLKIYPLYFGVYLISRREYARCARVAVYFLIIFILPFLFFDGGISNVPVYIGNLFRFACLEKREYGFSNMSLFSLIIKLFDFAGIRKFSTLIGILLSLSAFIFCTFVSTRTESNVTRAFCCLYAMTLLPPVSYFYSLVFILVCLVETANNYKKEHYVYLAMVGMLSFLPLIFMSIFMYHSIFLIVGLIYEIIEHNKEEKITSGGKYESSNISRRIRDENK